MTYFVYHIETFPSGVKLWIFEPFEFVSEKKAIAHAKFFHDLCGLDYKIVCSDEL